MYKILQTYQLAVERMLLDHNSVDHLWVLESEEAESARAPGGAIAHDCALDDFAELREVALEGF